LKNSWKLSAPITLVERELLIVAISSWALSQIFLRRIFVF
jgi:hypothetical protein